MEFLYVKALHIIFVVTWFSGLFYLCRLFIYNAEADTKTSVEKEILQAQFTLMAKRLLYGITWPSAILTLIFGIWLLVLYQSIPVWLYIKLGVVFLLLLYHISLHFIYRLQSVKVFKYSGQQLRLWNEIPTVLLVVVVMLVVVKQNISAVYGLVGLIALVAILILAIRIYKRVREGKGKTK